MAKRPTTARRMPLQGPRKPAGAFLEGARYPYSGERVKLISELLMAFKRLLPFYVENRPKHEVVKMKVEIKYHKRMLKEARLDQEST